MGYFLVRYNPRGVIYEHRGFIRLGTDVVMHVQDGLARSCIFEERSYLSAARY